MLQRRRGIYSWLWVGIFCLLLVIPSIVYPVERHSVDGGLFHIYRGVIFSAARDQGWFLPRWVQSLNAGLGSPLFSFYPPMTYMVMDALHRVGFDHIMAWRVIVALGFAAGASGAFALALWLCKDATIALTCSVLYAFGPYLLHDLFGRGSPEGLALCLVPWVLWCLLRLSERPSGGLTVLTSLLWATLCLTHTLAAVISLPVFLLLAVYAGARHGPRTLGAPVIAIALGTLLTAFYTVPFLLEQPYVRFENVHSHAYVQPVMNVTGPAFVFGVPALLDAGYGARSLWEPRLGPLYGAILLGGLIAFPMAFLRTRRNPAFLLFAGALALEGGLFWLQTAYATWFWRALPALQVIQFRWRLLAACGLTNLLILASLLHWLPDKVRAWMACFLLAGAMAVALPFIYPELYRRYATFTSTPTIRDAQVFSLAHTAPDLTGHFEFAPRERIAAYTLDEFDRVQSGPFANLPDGARVGQISWRDGHVAVEVTTPIAWDAQLHVLFYPGWVGTVDGHPTTLRAAPETGYCVVSVPAGSHTIALDYRGTRVQHISELVSILALLALPCLWRLYRRPTLVAPPAPVRFLQPRWWLAVSLAGLVCAKLLWMDPHTTWLRRYSTCEDVYGAQVHTSVDFGGIMHLCAYTLPQSSFSPGDRLSITLYWLKERDSDGANSFVHLLGSATNPKTRIPVWGQSDKEANADHFIWYWEKGKLAYDRYTFQIDPDTPPGQYQLEIGWYRPDWQRLEPTLLRPQPGLTVCNGALYVDGITIKPAVAQGDRP